MSETAGRAVLDAVEEDEKLLPEEKETTLRLNRLEDQAEIYTADAGVARRLLAHPAVPIEGVTVAEGDARPERTLEEFDGAPIVGVRAQVPVGGVLIKSRIRENTSHAAIVPGHVLSEVDDSDEADDAEAGDSDERGDAEGGSE